MPFEKTRVKLKDIVDAFHAAKYPTMDVNYKGRMVTDLDNVVDPFSMVEFSMDQKTLGLNNKHLKIYGDVLITHLSKKNSGSKIFSDYSSELSKYMTMKTVDGITFQDLNTFDGSGLPGFDGSKNMIYYEVEYFRE